MYGFVFNALPSPALPGSGSEGMFSARILRHPCWWNKVKIKDQRKKLKVESQKFKVNGKDLPEFAEPGRVYVKLKSESFRYTDYYLILFQLKINKIWLVIVC